MLSEKKRDIIEGIYIFIYFICVFVICAFFNYIEGTNRGNRILSRENSILRQNIQAQNIVNFSKRQQRDRDLNIAEKLREAEKLRVHQETEARMLEARMLRDYSIKDEKLLVEKSEKVVLSKPIFGIFLGENISALKNRLGVRDLGASSDNLTEYYQVRSNKNTNVKELYVYVFKEHIYYIRILFKDISVLNYNAIRGELTKKYKIDHTAVLQRKYTHKVFGAYFIVKSVIIDEVKISISLNVKTQYDKLTLTYIHQPLVNTRLKEELRLNKEALRLEANKVSNDL